VIRKTVGATVTAAVLGTNLFKTRPNDPSPGLTLSTSGTGWLASAEGTDGDYDVQDGFNILNGWSWLPYPEKRLHVPGAGIIAVKFPVTPSTAQQWELTTTLMELG
jgi:hypothetical protein